MKLLFPLTNPIQIKKNSHENRKKVTVALDVFVLKVSFYLSLVCNEQQRSNDTKSTKVTKADITKESANKRRPDDATGRSENSYAPNKYDKRLKQL